MAQSKKSIGFTQTDLSYETKCWQVYDTFDELHTKFFFEYCQFADPKNQGDYRAVSVFMVPARLTRWQYPKSQAHQPTIGQIMLDHIVCNDITSCVIE